MNAAIYRGQFGASQVVVNLECYPDDILGVIQQTRVHSQIDGQGIGPKFLGHATENTENTERVCGYMLESLPVPHYRRLASMQGGLSQAARPQDCLWAFELTKLLHRGRPSTPTWLWVLICDRPPASSRERDG